MLIPVRESHTGRFLNTWSIPSTKHRHPIGIDRRMFALAGKFKHDAGDGTPAIRWNMDPHVVDVSQAAVDESSQGFDLFGDALIFRAARDELHRGNQNKDRNYPCDRHSRRGGPPGASDGERDAGP